MCVFEQYQPHPLFCINVNVFNYVFNYVEVTAREGAGAYLSVTFS